MRHVHGAVTSVSFAGLQRQFRRVARHAGRRVRRDVGRVLIDELISPLRYHIMIRLRFYESYGEAGERIDQHLPALMADPTFVWFRDVRAMRHWPEMRGDPERFKRS